MKKNRLLHFVLVSAVAIGLLANGRALGNLVNLNNWTGQTRYGSSPNDGIAILSYNSALFSGFYSTGGAGLIVPVLTGSLNTTPGAAYEIRFTVANDPFHSETGSGTMSFGGFSAFIDLYAMGGAGSSENFDYLVTATSALTTMSFSWGIDNGYQVSLSNVSVFEVPETASSALLLAMGAGAVVFARRKFCALAFQSKKRD